MPQAHVGIREMKAHLSGYLHRVKKGESIEITERGKPVARLVPVSKPYPELQGVWDMVREGKLDWDGGKPEGASRPLKVKGKPLSRTIIEDRGDPIP